jgi:hypothetical protein
VEIKMDIKKAIKLANSKTATVQDVFQMIYDDIEEYSTQREDYYFEEFRSAYESGLIVQDANTADEQADKIYAGIEADVKAFTKKYANDGIDAILDAKNENKFTSKMGATNLLILLTSLKDAYEQ